MGEKKKLFISYAREEKDIEFAMELYNALEEAGFDPWLDVKKLSHGEKWKDVTIKEAIRSCDYFFTLFSSKSVNRTGYFQTELKIALEYDAEHPESAIFIKPIRRDNCKLPASLSGIHSVDLFPDYKAGLTKILVDLGIEPEALTGVSEPTDRDALPERKKLPATCAMGMKSINDRFVGRIRDLWTLHDKVQKSGTAIVTAAGVALVCGMGGIGKSQLAVEYVHRFGYLYDGGVFWIDAEKSRTDMVNRICATLDINLNERLDEDGQVETLWKFLGDGEPVLVVLDNFRQTTELEPWLPMSEAIHVLVTTRRKDLVDYDSLSLDVLSDEAGAGLINSRARKFEPHEAEALSNKLGGLPLALELACFYLNRKKTLSITDLIATIDQKGELKSLEDFTKNYSQQLPTGREKSIPAMFQMAWDSASEDAKDILRAMSVLAPYPVPRRLLGKILFKEYTPEKENTLDEGLSELAETLALTTLDHDSDPACHRLVIGFVQTTLEESDFSKTVAQAVLDEMGRVTDVYDEDSYKELEKVVPHGVHVLETDLLEIVPKIDMASRIRWHYRKHGQLRLAEKYGQEALEIALDNLEQDHEKIAECMSNLALVLQDLGDLEGAREHLDKALESDINNFGLDHSNVAIRRTNLAVLLFNLGELEEAMELAEAAYRAMLNRYGPDFPLTIKFKANLDALKTYL